MQSPCTAVLASKRLPRIVRIRCQVRYTWSSSYDSSAGVSPAGGRAPSPALLERLQVARFYHEDSSCSYPLLRDFFLRRDRQISLLQKRWCNCSSHASCTREL